MDIQKIAKSFLLFLFSSGRKEKQKTLKEEIKSFSIIIIIALLIRTFLFQPFIIPSGSMKPNLLIGDCLFVSKYTYGFTKYSLPFNLPLIQGRLLQYCKPQIGDVVVFKGPYDPEIDYIKRVVGLPGDTVKMVDGILYINDKSVHITSASIFKDDLWIKRRTKERSKEIRAIDSYIETLPNGVKHLFAKKDKFGSNILDNTQTYVVPKGYYFMVGDNRDESGDSRVQHQIGFVPEDKIIGKAQIIWFSTKAKWWQFWRWLIDIRYSRLLQRIK